MKKAFGKYLLGFHDNNEGCIMAGFFTLSIGVPIAVAFNSLAILAMFLLLHYNLISNSASFKNYFLNPPLPLGRGGFKKYNKIPHRINPFTGFREIHFLNGPINPPEKTRDHFHTVISG